MKRSIQLCCALCFVLLSAAARAQDPYDNAQTIKRKPLFSAGGGTLFLSDFSGGVDFSVPVPQAAPPPYNTWTTDITMKTPYHAGGAYGFFDTTYAEAGIAYFAGASQCSAEGAYLGETLRKDNQFSRNRTIVSAISFALLAKYPFEVSSKLCVFPLTGVEYRLALLLKEDSGGSDPNLSGVYSGKAIDFSALWFNAGAGFDYKITGTLFLRAEILYGLRLANKAENEIVSGLKRKAQSIIDTEVPAAYQSYIKPQGETKPGHGLTVKLAVGKSF